MFYILYVNNVSNIFMLIFNRALVDKLVSCITILLDQVILINAKLINAKQSGNE